MLVWLDAGFLDVLRMASDLNLRFDVYNRVGQNILHSISGCSDTDSYCQGGYLRVVDFLRSNNHLPNLDETLQPRHPIFKFLLWLLRSKYRRLEFLGFDPATSMSTKDYVFAQTKGIFVFN